MIEVSALLKLRQALFVASSSMFTGVILVMSMLV